MSLQAAERARRRGRGRVPALMIQGTGSDVGKSLLVAGLARAYARRGLRVRPFKPQNMSNNAAVTADGGEIGRAQALQARAAGVAAHTDMNPVLLKPQSETGAQLVVHGLVAGTASARAYTELKPRLMGAVLESFGRLADAAVDLVLVEGAGSPAEVNLRSGDIANMGFAQAADLPVVLVGDIDRGGVIASLVGTHALLSPGERHRLKGYVINKFRGDVRLFDDAIEIIGARTGLACLGVVPWFEGARHLPAEDALALEKGAPNPEASTDRPIRIAVPRLPHIANFDDLDPLAGEADVALDMVEPGRALPGTADVVLLAGSKATRAGLEALVAEGWDIDIRAHLRRGGLVVGLCGGYQMLGARVADPDGIEGPPGETAALGLLEIETTLGPEKTLREVRGQELATGAPVAGYEMHVGETVGPGLARPMLQLADGRAEGARSACGRIEGCYVHGLFTGDRFRHAFLARIRAGRSRGFDHDHRVERTLDHLAEHLEAVLDLDEMLEIARAR